MLDPAIQQAFGAGRGPSRRCGSSPPTPPQAPDAADDHPRLRRAVPAGGAGPGELPNAMRRIEQEADRMSRLVAELLELARLDRESSLDLTETDLAALAVDAVADARAVEPGRSVSAATSRRPWW